METETQKAIMTKYHGPTKTRGPRVSASDLDRNPHPRNQITLPWNYSLDSGENHDAAARALCFKLGWTSCDDLVRGGLPHGNVYVFNADSNIVPIVVAAEER